jgi:hypothetical protein
LYPEQHSDLNHDESQALTMENNPEQLVAYEFNLSPDRHLTRFLQSQPTVITPLYQRCAPTPLRISSKHYQKLLRPIDTLSS